MSEETTTSSPEIVKRSLIVADGTELDILTPYVVRDVTVVQSMRIPLYVNGTLKSTEELAALGLTVKEYTQDEVDTAYYAALYASNADLVTRVRQYKGYLDELGLAYTSTMDEITAAITGSETIVDKTAYALQVKAVYDAIVTNMEFCGSETPLVDTYNQLAKLIQYLPEES